MSTAVPPRRRWRWRRWLAGLVLAAAAGLGLLAAGVYVVARSARVHRWVLAEGERQATAALGQAVRIGDFRLAVSWARPAVDVDLYRVVVAGAAPYGATPLLTVAHVHAGVRIVSLWRRRWYLRSVIVDQPEVRVVVDAQGRTNLPHPASRGGGSVNMFQLGIRRLRIAGGVVSFNHRAQPLAADLQQLRVAANYEPAANRYQGSFSFGGGQLRLRRFQPIQHSLRLAFTATPEELKITSLEWTGAGSRVQATARVSNFAAGARAPLTVEGQYRMQADLGRLGSIFHLKAMPSGAVGVDGTASYVAGAKGNWLAGVRAAGGFRSPALVERTAGLTIPVVALSGVYSLASGNLSVRRIQAGVMGGQVSATVTMADVAAGPVTGIVVGLRGAQVDADGTKSSSLAGVLLPSASRATLGKLGLAGTVDASATLGWSRGFHHLQMTAQAQAAGAMQSGALAVPLRAQAQAAIAGNELTLAPATLQTPASAVRVTGTVGLGPGGQVALAVDARSRNLAEMETLARGVGLALGRPGLPGLGLGGSGGFVGRLSGPLSSLSVAGTLDASDLRVRQTAWRTVALGFRAGPDGITVTRAELAASGGGRIAFAGSVGLRQWAWDKNQPLRLTLSADRMPLAVLGTLAGRALPVEGALTAQLAMTGTAVQPSGQGSLRIGPARVRVGNVTEPVQEVTASFRGTGAAIAGQLQARLAAGTVAASGTFYPRQGRYQATLSAPALTVQRLHTVEARKLPIKGVLAIAASGQGTVANPGLEATISTPALWLDGQTVSNLSLQAGLADHVAHVTLASNAVATSIHASADITLSGDYPTQARLDTGVIPLATVLAAYAPSVAESVAGRAEIHATLQGPLRNPQAIQAHVQVPLLQIAYGSRIQVAATGPLRLDVANGVATLQPVRFTGSNTDMQVAASIPLRGGAISGRAQGTVNLALLHTLVSGLTAGGEAQLDITASGALPKPVIAGQIRVVNASVSTPGFPVGLQDGNGVMQLSGGRITIGRFQGLVGGGPMALSGAILLQPALRFDLAIQLSRVSMLLPSTVRETLHGDLTFTGTPQAALLAGSMQVDNVLTTSGFDFTTVLGQITNNGGVAAAPGSFVQNLALNVGVTAPNQVQITSPDFSVRAGVNISVRGTAAQPVVLGRVAINSGDLIFRGDRYVLSSGTLEFVNPNQTQAIVKISADTTIQQYDLHLNFQGPSDNLHTTYTSTPSLPPADIINLLAFGQTTEATASTPGNLGAESLIASAVSSQITDRVQRIAGISQVSVDPVLGGTGSQTAGARVTVQERVTGNLFVTISTDVTSTQRDAIQIQYNVSPKVSVSGVRNENGGYGVNVSMKRTW